MKLHMFGQLLRHLLGVPGYPLWDPLKINLNQYFSYDLGLAR